MNATAKTVIITIALWLLAFMVVELFKYAVWERIFPRKECNCDNHV